ncbi:disulfide bond formation protein DsbB [Rheinheimera baltica]|uniref:disulfide bond formation protein DsbB n=1 Tax=Rheinheimera baltica TaxID=67576 RepID=UPI00273E724A|nr:disulfide bond formation protein DsbB [Rheinheimera baltica]MDP5141610.1 disulfide bond formation protein DsbB [Rheinheimera baltica]MDP5151264.1 disulfide bond formation protein DsbB [Rheinheimera baltica]
MLQTLKFLTTQRWGWALVVLSSLGLLGTALYFQYGLNLQPCIKCIYVRSGFAGILLAGIIGLLAPKNALLRIVALLGVGAAAVFGALQAHELLSIEQLLVEGGFFSCSLFAEFPSWMPLDQWLPAIFEPTGSCGDTSWQFLGKSMAFWSALTLWCYAAVAALLLIAQVAKLSSNPYRG